MANTNKKLVSKAELPKAMLESTCRIKLMVGAGDIGVEVLEVAKILKDET